MAQTIRQRLTMLLNEASNKELLRMHFYVVGEIQARLEVNSMKVE